MKLDISVVDGLVFSAKGSDAEFGAIRPAEAQEKHCLNETELVHIADDDSGNAFAVATDGAILFWDHETNDLTKLASSWTEFVDGCALPGPVELDERDVRSAWIDPSFAKEQGLEVPVDGWIKKPNQ